MNYILYKCVDCQKVYCQFCDGGFVFCIVCKGVEVMLILICIGVLLFEDQGCLV